MAWSSALGKNIPLRDYPKSPLQLRHPAPTRGAYRDRHGRWVRDAMDAAASGARGVAGRASAVSDRTARRRPALKRLRRNFGPAAHEPVEGFWRRKPRTAKACGSGTRGWCQADGDLSGPTGLRRIVNSSATEAKGIRLREERAISRKTIAQGRPGVPAHLAVTRVHFVRTIAGAEGTRLSLRPLFLRANVNCNPRARRAAGGLLLFEM